MYLFYKFSNKYFNFNLFIDHFFDSGQNISISTLLYNCITLYKFYKMKFHIKPKFYTNLTFVSCNIKLFAFDSFVILQSKIIGLSVISAGFVDHFSNSSQN